MNYCRTTGSRKRTCNLRTLTKYAHLGVAELRELRQLREENARLKRVVADLTLDKHILTDVVRKKL